MRCEGGGKRERVRGKGKVMDGDNSWGTDGGKRRSMVAVDFSRVENASDGEREIDRVA